MSEDTICAPATSPIHSALALIRISGPGALEAITHIFPAHKKIKPRMAVYGQLVFKAQVLDDVVLTYYQAPRSFTGEDSIEISCHGNPLIVQSILGALMSCNVRMAEAGEFSKRAFVNGKVDLTEAEAINQIITARSEWEIEAALGQMHGSLKKAINVIKEKIITIKADIECGIDFVQEDIEFVSYEAARGLMQEITADITSLYQRCKIGEKISHGVDIPIAGKPNVGKSSILNLLLNAERAIVTDIPGTTRDLIKETIQIGGVHINVIDTAGIRDADCEVEKIGIEMSRNKILSAPMIIFVCDATTGIEEADRAIVKNITHKNIIYIVNKMDKASDTVLRRIEEELGVTVIPFSALQATGLTQLEEKIILLIKNEFVDYQNSFIADIRVLRLLEESLECCVDCRRLLDNSEPEEIVAFELNELIATLSEVTGEISADDVLHSVFSRFCIGK